ncbi:unnamed protein product [Prorocentrum cordatum]|uniref:Uncharacterized protein n=1 Tax=Prorocentrum cordatum TaxID=2364126 RepID=A0ABN9SRE0_9DINO|nr:unnamed protein product [Polarella glacialis]
MFLMRLVLRLPPTVATTSMKNYCLNPCMMRPTVAIICNMCLCLNPFVVCIVLPLTLAVAIICFRSFCLSSFVMSFLLPLPPPVAAIFFKNFCLNPFVMSFVPTPPLLAATICVKSFSLNLIVMTTVLPPSPSGLRMNLIVLTIALPLPPTVATICMKNVDLNPFVWSRWQPPPPTVATTAGLPLVPRICVEPIFSASAAAARPFLGWQSPWWIPTPPFMMLHVLRPRVTAGPSEWPALRPLSRSPRLFPPSQCFPRSRMQIMIFIMLRTSYIFPLPVHGPMRTARASSD